MLIDVICALVRALSFIALFQAAGVPIAIAMFGRHLQRSARSIRQVGFLSAIAGLVLVAAHYALEAARMAGALSGAFDMSLQQLVFDSPMSVAAGSRLVGLALVASAIRREGTIATAMGALGAFCIAFAFSFVGHTAELQRPIWLGLVLTAHLLVVAFWFGGVASLYIVTRLEHEQRAAQIVAAFSRIASLLVPGLFVMGIVLTVLLVDRWEVFGESYGLLLLAKVVGFALLMALASLNKWRYGPAMAAVPAAAVAFRLTVAAEYVLICGVLVTTAVMTTFFSPSH